MIAASHSPSAVLIVPDAALRKFLIEVLTTVGFEVRAAVGGVDLDALTKRPPEAIVMHTPLSQATEIAALAKLACTVVLTTSPISVSAEDLGVFCIVPTPFDLEELEAQLKLCLASLPAMHRLPG